MVNGQSLGGSGWVEHWPTSSTNETRAVRSLGSTCPEVLVAIVGMVCFQWPTFMQVSEIPRAQQRKQISDRIIAAIASHLDGKAANVMLTTTGYVNCDLLNYLSLR